MYFEYKFQTLNKKIRRQCSLLLNDTIQSNPLKLMRDLKEKRLKYFFFLRYFIFYFISYEENG